MSNQITRFEYLPQPVSRQAKRLFPMLGLLVGASILCSSGVRAASPNQAPPELKNSLSQIDAAGNSKNIRALMQFYSQNFTHPDGLTRKNMEQAISQLWQRYSNLNYRTELVSWDRKGNALIAETITNISGIQKIDGQEMKLQSTLRSRQRFEGQKIAMQEILEEQTSITSGAKPPTVDIKLPQQVRTGQEYNLDAIVKEPLGEDLLLGTAIEEAAQTDRYFKPTSFQLEPLASGGIFKLGKAPTKQGNYWISTVLIRPNGMTMITQRLKVVGGRPSGAELLQRN